MDPVLSGMGDVVYVRPEPQKRLRSRITICGGPKRQNIGTPVPMIHRGRVGARSAMAIRT
jgi:hypothetical protein